MTGECQKCGGGLAMLETEENTIIAGMEVTRFSRYYGCTECGELAEEPTPCHCVEDCTC